MPDPAPSHLVTRSNVIESHVRQLARDRGLQQDFGDELAAVGDRAEQARNARDRAMVEAAIEELRALARRLAAVPASGPSLAARRRDSRGDDPATLGGSDPSVS